MTLPKKNRRNIVVDGRQYHWQFDPFRLWGNDSFICVQDAQGHGPLLKMQWVGIALPNHVESAIRFAIANGWRPNGSGIFEIGADSRCEPVTFYLKTDDASRYWFYDQCYGEYSPRNPNNPNKIKHDKTTESTGGLGAVGVVVDVLSSLPVIPGVRLAGSANGHIPPGANVPGSPFPFNEFSP